MKKLFPILCGMALLLCGCGSQPKMPTALTLSPLTDPQDTAQAVADFENMLDYAIQSDDINYLKLHSATLLPKGEDLTITDTAVIRSFLSKLKKLKTEATRHEGGLTGPVYTVYLGLENGEVELCDFGDKRVFLNYYGRDVEYRLAIQNTDIVEELLVLISKQIQ